MCEEKLFELVCKRKKKSMCISMYAVCANGHEKEVTWRNGSREVNWEQLCVYNVGRKSVEWHRISNTDT